MHKAIAQLLAIQEKEQKIRRLREEKDSLPKSLEEKRLYLAKLEKGVQETKDGLKKLQVQYKEIELESTSKLENIARLETQLFTIKNNKDYQAMQKEIAERNVENERLEDKMLDLLEEMENKKNILVEGQAEVEKQKKAVEAEESRVKEEIARLDNEMEKIEKKRDKLLPGVNGSVLDKYRRIFARKRDTAVVPLTDYICGGCHMHLPPQTASNVRKTGELVICENCSRILYWPEGVERAAAENQQTKAEQSADVE